MQAPLLVGICPVALKGRRRDFESRGVRGFRRVPALVVSGLAVIAATAGCGGQGRVSFSRDVQPIFDGKCVSCHPVSYPQLDLRAGRSYRELVRVPAKTNLAFQRVLPNRPELSFLLTHPSDPQTAGLLSRGEAATIRRWIEDGAPDD